MFLARGYDAATTTEIARDAKVAEGTIYRYARNKRHLFEQVITEWYREMHAEMMSGLARAETTKEKLAFAVEQHFKVFSDHAPIAQLMVREMRAKPVGQRGEIDALNRSYTQFLIDLLKDGQKDGTIRDDLQLQLARDVFFGTIEHAAMRKLSSSDAKSDVETFTREFWAMVSAAPSKTQA